MSRRLLHAAHGLRVRASTVYSPTDAALTQYLRHSSIAKTSSTLFLLSTSLPSSSLEPFLSILHAHCPLSIGSFSSSLPDTEPFISIATFEDSLSTFQTDLTGRAEPEVGRWHRPRELESEDLKGTRVGEMDEVGASDGWAGMWKAEEAVERIPQLEGISAESLILLSDSHPNPLLQALRASHPAASTVGLLTAQTPFITGRPHTLFRNGKIHSSGTVGIVLPHRLSHNVDYGLSPLTKAYRVTKAQGNLLLSIDDGGDGNPARTLITALQKQKGRASIGKEEEWFLSIRSEDDSLPETVVKILSGDPSKGALSLETEMSLVPGELVQFLHRTSPLSTPAPLAGRLTFAGLSKTQSEGGSGASGSPRVVDGFLGMSEDGFSIGASICKVPGATVIITST